MARKRLQLGRPTALPAPQGGKASPATQDIEDMIADRGAILRSGKTMGTRPVGQRLLGGLSGNDPVENFDRGGNACGWGHDDVPDGLARL
jgi:hypothetical protein